jgi:hypothetical protein
VKAWLVGLAVAAAAAVVVLRARSPGAAPESVPSASIAPAAPPSLADVATRAGFLFRTVPAPGRQLTYRVTWTDELHTDLGNTLGPAAASLAASVVLTALQPRNGESVVELSVESLEPMTDPSTEDAGSSVAMTPGLVAQVVGARADLVVHPDGALQSIRFGQDVAAGGRAFVQRLVGLLVWSPPEQPERTTFGSARTVYEPKGPAQLFRSRESYTAVEGLPPRTELASLSQELDSGAMFTFGDDGALESLVDSESLRLVRDDGTTALEGRHGLTVHRLGSQDGVPRAAPDRLATLDPHGPWESPVDPDADRRAVEARLEGLTGPIMLAHVRALAALGPKAPDQLKFFNQATGLVKLHPELAAQLADLVNAPGMTYEGRAMALDILTSAGNSVAQGELVRALRDSRTRGLPEYVQLYQRVGLVTAPGEETVAFARDTFERLHATPPKDQDADDLRTASVYTLGSVAGHLYTMRRADAAAKLGDRIVQAMDRGDGASKEAYITALGNAGLPAQQPRLLALSDDGDVEVRVSAINALRKYDTTDVRNRMLSLLTGRVGKSPHVDRRTQDEALRVLQSLTPTRADVQRLAAAIVSDNLSRDLYGETIPVFRRGIAPLEDVSKALDAMFERSAQLDGKLQIRIDTLRAELSTR